MCRCSLLSLHGAGGGASPVTQCAGMLLSTRALHVLHPLPRPSGCGRESGACKGQTDVTQGAQHWVPTNVDRGQAVHAVWAAPIQGSMVLLLPDPGFNDHHATHPGPYTFCTSSFFRHRRMPVEMQALTPLKTAKLRAWTKGPPCCNAIICFCISVHMAGLSGRFPQSEGNIWFLVSCHMALSMAPKQLALAGQQSDRQPSPSVNTACLGMAVCVCVL